MKGIVGVLVSGGVIASGIGCVSCKVKRDVVEDTRLVAERGLNVGGEWDMSGVIEMARMRDLEIEEPEIVVDERDSMRRVAVRGRVLRSKENDEMSARGEERMVTEVRDTVSVRGEMRRESEMTSGGMGVWWKVLVIMVVGWLVWRGK